MKDSKTELEPQTKKQKTEHLTLERCLNDLAWLLEKDESSCAAVCLVNNKLFITDNNLGALSKFNITISHQFQVIKYLRQLINPSEKSEQPAKILLKSICKNKFKTLFKGQMAARIDDETLAKILDTVIDEPKITPNKVIKKLKLTRHSTDIPFIISLYERIVRQSQRILDYLHHNPESPLIQALLLENDMNARYLTYSEFGALSKLDTDWTASNETKGCKLLLTNNIGTHAELKIIDFLLTSRLLTLQSNQTSFQIGISKKCCRSCKLVIDTINTIFKKKYDIEQSILMATASHDLVFDNWKEKLPIFLFNPNAYGNSYEQGLYFAENFQQVGYIQSSETGETKELLTLDTAVDEKWTIWLYRDAKLLKKFRQLYKKSIAKLKLPNAKVGPMVQSSPEASLSEKEPDKWIPNVYISNLKSEFLIDELKTRVEKYNNIMDLEYLSHLKKRLMAFEKSQIEHADSDELDEFSFEISRQVTGVFEDNTLCFDVFKTLGDGNCGFYSLPIPFDKIKVVKLLIDNKTRSSIRKQIANEIIESLKTNYLPKSFTDKHQALLVFKHQEATADLAKGDLLRAVLDVIDPERNRIMDRAFSNVMAYLSALGHPTAEEAILLTQLQAFATEQEQHTEKLKALCESEAVYTDFIEYCVAKNYRLSFSRATHNFDKTSSLLDAIIELIDPPIYIIIWGLKSNSTTEVEIIYQGGSPEAIPCHIFHTPGLDTHFELMAKFNQPMQTGNDHANKEKESNKKTTTRALFFDQQNTSSDKKTAPTKVISNKKLNS